MTLHVATVATHSERYLPVLEKMIEDRGIKLKKLGFGKKYQGHFMKDLEMIEFLKTVPKEDIVVFLDGFDTLMLSDTEEVIKKFRETGKKMVISIENIRNSFLTHSYHFQKVQEKFINTGLYIGYAGYVLEFLKEMYSQDYNKKSNQTTWSSFLNKPKHKIDLDHFGVDSGSKIFLNHSPTCNNKFKFIKDQKRLVMEDKTRPCFIQGNGVVNMDYIINGTGYKDNNIYKDSLFWERMKYNYKAVFKTYPILKFFISGILIFVFLFLFTTYSNYKNRKFETFNLTFS